MNFFIGLGRGFYGTGLIVYGLVQIYFTAFRPVIVPEWPTRLHTVFLIYVIGTALIIAGLCISGVISLKRNQAKNTCLVVGGFFLTVLLFCHVPHELFISPNSPLHLGVWANALKELALCGGAFVMAGSYGPDLQNERKVSIWGKGLRLLISLGPVFFSTTMILFGVSHFYYTDYVAPMVPHWFGMPRFWTYLGGVALIGAGACIILGMYARRVALLLAVMLFIWFLVLHVPGAVANPTLGNGNQIASAFDALLFCGVALAIAYKYSKLSKQTTAFG